MVFAVDFDGTLSFGRWPGVGPANVGLLEFLKKRRESGDRVVLWTCREGKILRMRFCGVKNLDLNLML